MNYARWAWLGASAAASGIALAHGDKTTAAYLAAAGPALLGLGALVGWLGPKLR